MEPLVFFILGWRDNRMSEKEKAKAFDQFMELADNKRTSKEPIEVSFGKTDCDIASAYVVIK